MHLLEQKIRAANAEGRPALVPFLTAGFPDRSAIKLLPFDAAKALENAEKDKEDFSKLFN